MICNKCGKDNKEDAVFCQFCGEKVLAENFQNEPLYNTIPIWKLILLLIVSFGFYEIVWGFNLWKQGQKKYDKKISPLWRAIFLPITNFKLFPLINNYITNIPINNLVPEENNKLCKSEIKPFHATFFATIYLLFHLIQNMFSNINSSSQSFTFLEWILLLFDLITVAIIVTIQSKINKYNKKYNIPVKNDKWTWLTTGFVFFWILTFFGFIIISSLLSQS